MFRLLLLAALVAVFVALLARYPLGTSERCARAHADLARREMGNLRIELDPEPNPEPNPEPAVVRATSDEPTLSDRVWYAEHCDGLHARQLNRR
jgi:hypothetical protein